MFFLLRLLLSLHFEVVAKVPATFSVGRACGG
jgi:hypothetical protein